MFGFFAAVGDVAEEGDEGTEEHSSTAEIVSIAIAIARLLT